MNVGELIAELQKLDPSLPVIREFDFEGCHVEVQHVDVVERAALPDMHHLEGATFYRKTSDVCFGERKIVDVVYLD